MTACIRSPFDNARAVEIARPVDLAALDDMPLAPRPAHDPIEALRARLAAGPETILAERRETVSAARLETAARVGFVVHSPDVAPFAHVAPPAARPDAFQAVAMFAAGFVAAMLCAGAAEIVQAIDNAGNLPL